MAEAAPLAAPADDFGAAFGGRGKRRIVVVAPHPDDDVIGCGGTLARAAAAGAAVKVVYVTDGSASHPRSVRFPPRKLRALREREARRALRVLGIGSPPAFLRAPDAGLDTLPQAERARLVVALRDALAAAVCDVIFSPWPLDPHADHVATAGLVEEALRGRETAAALYLYRVWATPAPEAAPGGVPELVVALDPATLEKKRRALLEHRSQTSDFIDDDPGGFRADDEQLARWLQPVESFFATSSRGGRA